MPATPQTFRTLPWLIAEDGSKIIAASEEQYFELMNDYFAKEYAGLSHPIIGDDIYQMKDPVWALKNLIQENGLTIIHGQPGSYKSFMAMDWAYSLSSPYSTGWMGQQRAKQFRAMYLFTEGMHGLKNRSKAWSMERSRDIPSGDDGVVWVRDRVGLNATGDPVNPFSRQVASLVKMYNDYHCNILFIDTLANTFVGNENLQQDANSYLRTLSVFLEGGPVVLIHHNKKGEKEFRGSTVFHGAVDTLVSMEKTLIGAKLEITKQKDGPEDFFLHLKAIEHSWAGRYADQQSIALQDYTQDHWVTAEHEEILALLITHQELTVKHAAELFGYTSQTMKSRLDKMVEKGKLVLLEDVKPATYTLNEPEEI